ncbi:MAG: hypothetical protein LBG74_05480 [Spirochaetaceae bacterium]|nr:hypothetical protein [Spirochaetaceae bacterium]
MKAKVLFCLPLVFLASCDLLESRFTFDASLSRTVVITDVPEEDEDGNPIDCEMRLSEIDKDQYIILALFAELPGSGDWTSSVTAADLVRTAFASGRIENGKFECKLVKANLDYWTASGPYWLAFVMADNLITEVTLGYLSKVRHYFQPSSHYLYLTNQDFMGDMEMSIDISNLPGMPFNNGDNPPVSDEDEED